MNHNQCAILFDSENIKPHEIIDELFKSLNNLNYDLLYPRKMIVNDLGKIKKAELSDDLKKYRLDLSCTYADVRKNLLDFRLYIEALDLAYTQNNIEAFCIVSNDADYAELAIKLRLMGKTIIGVGSKATTNEDYQKLFNHFYFIEELKNQKEIVKSSTKKKKQSTKDQLLSDTINTIIINNYNNHKARIYYSNLVSEVKKVPALAKLKLTQDKLIKLGYNLEYEDEKRKETAYIKIGDKNGN